MENIQRITSRARLIVAIEKYLMDKQVVKELGEPLFYDKDDIWLIRYYDTKPIGFLCYNKRIKLLKYLYVEKEFRKNGIGSSLLSKMHEFAEGLVKAVSTKQSINLYISDGWEIKKSFVNYFNVSKSYEFIR